MTIAHLLEDFDLDLTAPGTVRLMTQDMIEEHRLAAFERGYSAGWEDALSAQTNDHAQLSASVAQSVQDMGFTYQEAMAHLTTTLEPMFRSLTETVLPDTIEQGFAQRVVETLKDMAEGQLEQPALLVVPPGAGAALKPALDQALALPVQVVEEQSLLPGQACLRVGTDEREIDCVRLMNSISDAMSAFLTDAGTEVSNG